VVGFEPTPEVEPEVEEEVEEVGEKEVEPRSTVQCG
jgi:hypothetical protein